MLEALFGETQNRNTEKHDISICFIFLLIFPSVLQDICSQHQPPRYLSLLLNHRHAVFLESVTLSLRCISSSESLARVDFPCFPSPPLA